MLKETAYVSIAVGGFLLGVYAYLKYRDGDLTGKFAKLFQYKMEIAAAGGILLLGGIAILGYQYMQTGQLM